MSIVGQPSIWEQIEAHRQSQIVEVRDIVENGRVVGQVEVDEKGLSLAVGTARTFRQSSKMDVEKHNRKFKRDRLIFWLVLLFFTLALSVTW